MRLWVSSMDIVKVESVWVYCRDNLVLKDVSLNIGTGEFLGLIGPNGGGKTTLVKVILGLVRPDKGRVEVFGSSPERLGKKRPLIGYLPQRNLIDWEFPASVLDVVMMGRYGQIGVLKPPSREDREKALQVLERVGMVDLAQRQIGQLSAGQQQRVFIARALVTSPKLLLLDEPVAGVDAATQDKFYQFLGELKEELGLTIVMVSHDLAVISNYVEKLACLNQNLHIHAPPEEVFASGSLKKVYGCEVELLTHGLVPHRVVEKHKGGS